MIGYSKIRVVRTNKPKSMDFSDPISPSPSQNSKPFTNPNLKPNSKTQQDKSSKQVEQDYEEFDQGEKFGVILKRNYSVSSISTHKLRALSEGKEENKKLPPLQCALRRAFSIRKTSEEYCRIHDQSDLLSSPTEEDDIGVHNLISSIHTGSKKKKNKKNNGSKILKVCKDLLGL